MRAHHQTLAWNTFDEVAMTYTLKFSAELILTSKREYLIEVFQDRKGNLWFGTIGRGLACFDGKKLRYYSLEDGLIGSQVNGIAEDENGHLWLATTMGISMFDGQHFTNFTYIENYGAKTRPASI